MKQVTRIFFLCLLCSSRFIFASLSPQKESLFNDIKQTHDLPEDKAIKLRQILESSSGLHQGNPEISSHPITQKSCLEKTGGIASFDNKDFMKICGHRFMAPLYDPSTQKPEDASSCIDQFEFPNIPCSYPMVWIKAQEAQRICEAVGKRLCDAGEWEGGCAGSYQLETVAGPTASYTSLSELEKTSPKALQSLHDQSRSAHNKQRKILWAYGAKENKDLCAIGSTKSSGCDEAVTSGKDIYNKCGSNTYPAGSFPQCVSKLGVYDQHGNSAEHMNLAFKPSELTRNGGTGVTEMKGSWFIFKIFKAHNDDCHWRAPFWHGTTLMSNHSHEFYHLGFRCCANRSKP